MIYLNFAFIYKTIIYFNDCSFIMNLISCIFVNTSVFINRGTNDKLMDVIYTEKTHKEKATHESIKFRVYEYR